mmetsp:Transcript_90506/g.174218  ORF Transcript_90506/g.174218 Transcript_90506/m.174218 type:complete len:382 (-) Transcript_90506:103-1248(-)
MSANLQPIQTAPGAGSGYPQQQPMQQPMQQMPHMQQMTMQQMQAMQPGGHMGPYGGGGMQYGYPGHPNDAAGGPQQQQQQQQELQEQQQPHKLSVLRGETFFVILNFLDLQTKIRCLITSSQIAETMQSRCAWDPLHLDQACGRAFLRLLKRRDPLGCFTADISRTKRMFPAGLFQVQRLEAVLMNPERVEQEQSDTEDDTPRPKPLVIADPLDEVCKRLRHYFTSVNSLYISNIEDYRMDYRFVGLRASRLSDFGFVELMHLPTAPPTYALRACRDMPPRTLDLDAIMAENRLRLPAGILFDESTTISEREALYLAEHRSAFKNGEDFHLVHAFYRTVRSHGVRKRYKAVVAALRARFPANFPTRAGDQGSPCHHRGARP